jgi:hypothetical protein
MHIMDLGLVTVELLAPEGTPEHQVISPTAQDDLEKAITKLVYKQAESFYTVLRCTWSMPTLLWRIAPK